MGNSNATSQPTNVNAEYTAVAAGGEEDEEQKGETHANIRDIVRNPTSGIMRLFGSTAQSPQSKPSSSMTKKEREAAATNLGRSIGKFESERSRNRMKIKKYEKDGLLAKRNGNQRGATRAARIAKKLEAMDDFMYEKIEQFENLSNAITMGNLNEITVLTMAEVVKTQRDQMRAMGNMEGLEKLMTEFSELMNEAQAITERLNGVNEESDLTDTLPMSNREEDAFYAALEEREKQEQEHQETGDNERVMVEVHLTPPSHSSPPPPFPPPSSPPSASASALPTPAEMKLFLICLSLFILVTHGGQQQQPSQRYHRGYRSIDTTPTPPPTTTTTTTKGSALETEHPSPPPVSWSWLWEWFTLPLGRLLSFIGSWVSWIWSLLARVIHFFWDVAYLRALWQDHVTWPLVTWLVRGLIVAQLYWALRIIYKIILS